MAERPRSQLRPPGRPRELEPTSGVDGHDAASGGSLVASAPPRVTGTDTLDVGEQIRRLQALAELRATGILTDGELADLKRRVLSSGPDAPLKTPHAGTMQAPHIGGPRRAEAAPADNGRVPPADTQRTGPAATGVSSAGAGTKKARDEISGVSGPGLDRREPKGSYVAALKVVGTIPVTCRVGANKRPSYARWKKALHAAAAEAAAKARPTSSELFSLRIELRLHAPGGQGSDLDNYVKPIQDALAEQGVFGPTAHEGSTMRGDERIDHLDVRRQRVSCNAEAGVLAEVWALDA